MLRLTTLPKLASTTLRTPIVFQNLPPLKATVTPTATPHRGIHSTAVPRMVFEGNTSDIQTSEEERLTRVFGGRLKGEPPRSTSRIDVGSCRKIAGIDVPEKPKEPNNCCMSGCTNCVWELYNDDIRYWKRQRKIAANEINKTDEVWPEHWSAPIKLLNLKNVPNSLKSKKEELIKSGRDHDSRISIDEVSRLFPKREGPLPKSVLAARKRRAEARRRKQLEQEDDDNEGWDDVPVYIRAFAEFERAKRLERKNLALEQ